MPDQAEPPANGSRETGQRTPRGVSPIVPGRAGRPSYSLDALRELVERQFSEETAGRVDILLALDSDDKRRALLEEIADYVLAVEAITLTPADRRRLIERAYANLFAFGPLDDLLRDPAVTEITVNGPHDIHVRHGMAALSAANAAFDDIAHLEVILQRVLASTGSALDEPFLEAGVALHGRRARLSVIGPPVRSDYSLHIRLHPVQPLTLDDLRDRFAALDDTAITLLRAILRAGHGLLIVGDTGLGKTTLAGALLRALVADSAPHITAAIVERAAELHLPANATHHVPAPNQTFADALVTALDTRPGWLFADEVCSDDAAALWDALTRRTAPCYVWVFRGTHQPDRLKSALSMVIRQYSPAIPQTDINAALMHHLPFVVTLRRVAESARLAAIAEWTPDSADPAALTLRALLQAHGDGWATTGARPAHTLDLPDTFWT